MQVGRLSGHAWEQVALPLHLRRSGSPLLLGLANTGPVAYRPQVVTCHDIIWARHPESFARSFRLLYATMTPLLLRRSAHVLTVSPFSRGELVREFGIDPRRITVVANAVSPAFHADGPAHDEGVPYVLAVSSPNRHKNFDALVAAFEAADLTHIHRLLIVGQQARAFHTQATTAAPRTRALGRVDDDELMRLYRGATAFAFPSLYEGFGIPRSKRSAWAPRSWPPGRALCPTCSATAHSGSTRTTSTTCAAGSRRSTAIRLCAPTSRDGGVRTRRASPGRPPPAGSPTSSTGS